MNKVKTIVKYELIRYFSSPIAYVYLVSFLLLSGSCAIYFGHFFTNGEANLNAFFDYQPWIYLLFISGIAMRSWSDEFRSRSVIQLLTTPLSLSQIVWGKFLAMWAFAIFAIALTFPFWITVNILGNPDNGVIFIGYLGCFILCGAMIAIAQTLSSVTKNSIVALVLSVLVNLMFFWSSFEYVLFWAREVFSEVVVDTIISFSFLIRFFSLSRGVVELRDVVFFASLIVFFNILTIFIVGLKTKGTSSIISSANPKHAFIYILVLFVAFFSLNIIANNTLRLIRFDFTSDKYMSLTKNTKNILKNLKRPVVAKLYYSSILEQRNPYIRQTYEQIKLLLKQYKSYSKGKFDYRIYNPKFLDKIEDNALADGLQPIPLIDNNQNALFGITFSDSLTNKSVIPFFSMERLSFLEQDLTTSIYKLHHKKKVLGLLSSIPVAGNLRQEDVYIKKWELLKEIEALYDVKIIKNEEDLDQYFDVMLIIHPKNYSQSVIDKIKKQKKVLLLLDVADDASFLYSPIGGNFIPSDLSGLDKYWGIGFYNLGVAADFNNSITVDDTVDYSKNPSFTQDLLQFKVTNKELNSNHRITYKLNDILFSSATMVYPLEGADVSFFPLIKTSKKSSIIDAELMKNKKSPREILEKFTPTNDVIILGAEVLSNNPENPFNIIVVGDTDFAYDAFWTMEKKFLGETYYVPMFDNANFVLNSLDYLTGNDDLISLRGKTAKRHPLFVVDEMRKINTYRYKLKENDIFNAIDGAKAFVAEIIAKKTFEERDSFSADELAIIGKIRNEITTLRQQLSELKTNTNNSIKKLEARVKFYNIYFIALVIVLMILIASIKNNKDVFVLKNGVLFWNKHIAKLSVVTIGLLVLAIVSVYLDNRNSISKYEGKLMFENFSEKVNKIKKITLKKSKQNITFVQNNGLWEIEGNKNIPVYQERIRSFLVTLNNAVKYEKKSDKVEDLKFFGFSSLSDKNSPTIEVLLEDEKGVDLENFEIGWFDIDIGRGSKACFMKQKNQFLVWMVEADFYDLSIDEKNWTYSSLWNLRFGRFIKYNDVVEEKDIMNMVKKLLNIYTIGAQKNIDAQFVGKINIMSENGYAYLSFYETNDDRYFVKYAFNTKKETKHIDIFEKYVKGLFLEINKEDWEKIKDDTIK